MALNGLICAEVPLRIYSPTYPPALGPKKFVIRLLTRDLFAAANLPVRIPARAMLEVLLFV